MRSAVYQNFLKRWEEITDLPPQHLGILTPVYKKLTRRLKIMPWPALVAVAVCLVLGCYFLIGSTVTLIASILQRGF